jgi:tetratricopeptide (TPR) repeat protein
MRLPLIKRRNRRRNVLDHWIERVFGSRRWQLTRWEKFQRFVLPVIAVVMPLLTWRYGQSVVETMKAAKVRHVAARAEKLILKGRSHQAISDLVRVCDLDKHQPEVVRGLAWAGAEDFPAQSSVFFDHLCRTGDARRDDLMMQGHLLLRLGDAAGCATLFSKLIGISPEDPALWRSWGTACLLRGQQKEAARAFRRVLDHLPHDPQATVALADMFSQSRTRADHDLAAEMLIGQLRRAVGARFVTAAHSMAAMLTGLAPERPDLRKELATLLKAMPDPETEHRMAAVFFSFPAIPSAKECAARREGLRHLLPDIAGVSDDERASMVACLQRHGEHALVLDWVTPALAAADAGARGLRVRSLLALGLWREAASLAQSVEDRDMLGSPLLLKALSILGESRQSPRVAESLLNQAMEDVAPRMDAGGMLSVGYAAMDHGLNRMATRALSAAMELSGDISTPVNELMSAARRGGATAPEVMRSLAKISARPGTALETRKRAAYLQLLCGEELERAALDVLRLREELPDDPYLRFLNAFAHYRLGDHQGALKSLLPLPKYRWHQGEVAVMTAILSSGGEIAQAASLAGGLTGAGMFDEEMRFLTGNHGGEVIAAGFSPAMRSGGE